MYNKFIGFLFVTWLACVAQPCQAQSDSGNCPVPVGIGGGGIGPRIPGYYDMMDQLSPNGRMLSYLDQQGDNGAHILNLESLADTIIQVHGGLPREEDISWEDISWCPYDSDLIALNVISFVDTTNNPGPPSLYVENAFIYRISTGEAQIIMPPGDSPYGSTGTSGWLPGSKPGMDSLLIDFWPGSGSSFNGIYVSESQELISVPFPNDTTGTAIYSPNHEDSLTGNSLNGQPIIFPRAVDTNNLNIQWTFSPDSKLLAFQIEPYPVAGADSVFYQVWVYNTNDPTKCIDVINFQNLYCKYSLDGIWPQFITDSTLAVSMYTDGDEFSPLWEITIDGRIIRQLTFLHAASIVEGEPTISSTPLHVFPNPATDELQILGGSGIGDDAAGTVHLFDIMGRERMTANDDGTGATLDVSRLEAGTYFLRLGNQSAKVEVTH